MENRRRPIRVAHLITDLDRGGAETTLVRLIATFDPAVIDSTVISLRSGGALIEELTSRGVRVHELGMRSGRINASRIGRAARLLRAIRPDVVQTWLYHADLVGLVAGTLARVPVIVWNIRCAELDPRDHPPGLVLLLRTLAFASRWPAAVICNSSAGIRAHEALGYRPRRWTMIPNGFDTDLFAPDAAARAEVRREIGVGDGVPLVGLVGRLHPMKDHATFLAAAAVVLRSHPAAHFVLVGRGVPESERLQEQVGALGLRDHVHFQGERHDVPRVFAALDVAVCSSYSEAFPNVVAEAMACGTPVVTTNAGDAASIVGNVGRIVPPRHPELLAAAVLELLAMTATSREALGLAGRARIVERYSLSSAASRYQSLYRELARRAKSRRRLVCAG